MGLFSSSTKYNAHAGSSSLIEEEDRNSTTKGLMLQATITDDSTLAEAVKMGLQTDMYARARSMMRYAGRVDGYKLGFPETDHEVVVIPPDAVQTSIETTIGEAIENLVINHGTQSSPALFSYALSLSYTDLTYFPWSAGDPLVVAYNSSAATIEIPVEDPSAIAPASPYFYADNPPEYTMVASKYHVTWSYTDDLGDPRTWDVPVDIPVPATDDDTILASYNRVSTPGITEYWTYQIGSAVDPTLEAAIRRQALQMEYLPIVVLMHDTKWFDELGDQELEDTTDSILKRLALDPYDLKEQYIEQVQESIDSGDRPGEEKLDDWDFFIQFATPLHTQIRGSRECLYYYFKQIESAMPTFTDYQAYLSSGGAQPYGELHITEFGDQGYNAEYRYSYIHSKEVVGEYTPPGWTEPLNHNRAYSKIYKIGDVDYAEGIEEMHGVATPVASTQGDNEEHSYIIITLQRDVAGVPTYFQLLCMGPSMQYLVNTSDTDTGGGDFRERIVEVELFPEDPEEESEFRIPVHYDSLKAVPAMHREECLHDAICATVYLVEKQKVKWYQKTFFKWLIVIIVIVVVIIAQHYHLLSMVKEMAVAAFAVGATATALAFAALYVAMVFALGFLISFAGSLIGGDLGQLFIIAATLYMAGVNPFANMSNAWGNLVANTGFGTAISFIQAVQPILTVANLAYSAYQTDKLEGEMKDFMRTAREKYDELRDAYDMLGPSPTSIDPMFIVSIFTGHYTESPESFYNRTLNANPGVLGYDLINDFSEVALTLPEDGSGNNIVDSIMNSFARQRGAA